MYMPFIRFHDSYDGIEWLVSRKREGKPGFEVRVLLYIFFFDSGILRTYVHTSCHVLHYRPFAFVHPFKIYLFHRTQ